MSSNRGRSVRLRAEKRPELDVQRFARAILALGALLKLEAEREAAANSSKPVGNGRSSKDGAGQDDGAEAAP